MPIEEDAVQKVALINIGLIILIAFGLRCPATDAESRLEDDTIELMKVRNIFVQGNAVNCG